MLFKSHYNKSILHTQQNCTYTIMEILARCTRGDLPPVVRDVAYSGDAELSYEEFDDVANRAQYVRQTLALARLQKKDEKDAAPSKDDEDANKDSAS